MTTIESRLQATHNRPAGFDYLRILLSLAVMLWHTVIVCYGGDAEVPWWTGPLRPLPYAVVPCFFALSGFLVAGSLERNDLPAFLTLRAMRIFPALAAEVLISALLIGPLVTSVPWSDYFSSPLFFSYLANVTGDIHFLLPGVFNDLPAGAPVNIQLWTVPFELQCYIAASVVSVLALQRRPRILFLAVVAICAAAFLKQAFTGVADDHLRPSGHVFMLAFLGGLGFYAVRRYVPWNGYLGLGAAVLSWVLLLFPLTANLMPIPLAYMTVYVGLLNPRRLRVLQGADYSYGVYLYGYPIQQTLSFFFPASRIWWVNFVVSTVITCGFAALSWHLLESKVMARKGAALRFVRRCSDWVTGQRNRILVRARGAE